MGIKNILFILLFIENFFRALEIVRDLNTSESRKSKFTEMALQKILDSHLSAKYSYLGRLG
jgi:hypothetical protein